ncbi:MAG TPA: FAD-binding oxidoreductase [Gammaproteobacteria bacterium]
MAVLPPNVSAENFASAVRELAGAIGDDWVFTSEEDVALYRDPYSLMRDTERESLASAAVAPSSVEEVQQVVRIANKYKTPLYPISTGKNYAYGGASANLSGSVIVDLKRMNRVLKVDDERNFALVEPGVSYFDLYRYIQERGLKVWIDCADVTWGGLVGNALDRGMGYTMPFYRDHANAACGVEVVLANGEVMRTGMGALPNADTWQEYKHGFGPDPSGLFPQGNFGIVTKMGFRLMPQPEHYRTGLIRVPKRRDLIQAIKIVNYLSDSHMIGEVFYESPLRALLGDAGFRAAVNRRGGADEAELDRYAADNGLSSWQVELQFYGPEATCLANWEYAKERFAREIPGAAFVEGESLKVPLTEEQLLNPTTSFRNGLWHRKVSQGIPEMSAWSLVGTRSPQNPEGQTVAHAGFFPVIPRSGEAVFKAQQVFGDAFAELGLPPFNSALSTPLVWAIFAYQMTFPLPDDNERLHRALVRLVNVAAENGWGDYRTPPFHQDHVSDTYSFGNHALRRFNETLKDAIDPNGILAPGRGGVWPSNYRQFRYEWGDEA